MKNLYTNYGVSSLMNGLSVRMLRGGLNIVIFFSVYDSLKDWDKKYLVKWLSLLQIKLFCFYFFCPCFSLNKINNNFITLFWYIIYKYFIIITFFFFSKCPWTIFLYYIYYFSDLNFVQLFHHFSKFNFFLILYSF